MERAFALSGNQIMSVFDAAIDSGVELLHVRHEAAAVHMADAFGRLTGRPGVALVTAGPGFANTLSALYVALMAESPLVLLSGCAPHRDSAGAFQDMPQADMALPVAKASWTLAEGAPTRASSWPGRSASRRRGVPAPCTWRFPWTFWRGMLRPRPGSRAPATSSRPSPRRTVRPPRGRWTRCLRRTGPWCSLGQP